MRIPGVIPYSRFFLRYLNSTNGQFYNFIFMNGSVKIGNYSFEGLNFTNDQHPQKSRIYSTYLKKPTIQYFKVTMVLNKTGEDLY